MSIPSTRAHELSRSRCGRDEALRREVDSLLAAHESAANFLADTATAPAGPERRGGTIDR